MFKRNRQEQTEIMKTYRYLLYSLIAFTLPLVGILVVDGVLLTADIVVMIFSNVVFLFFLAKLANLLKKNSFYWVIGAIVFFPFGVPITFIKMRTLCITNKGAFSRNK
ncbi:MAG: hypothetical protein B7Z60_00965 [Ferrovum sp. 37-45-19]|jgi:hypothetical protein|uniref:hypothetical protein n=1 Tax=Ferrovum sp. JA12 TaxID=1356299 RepID=UPI0007036B5B|nr:hypothetical protein [Ferrovum sp. JA12]OYV79924.1 MAG: hypothetical protein B7Z65_04255 [Ferrovum sp. 21-44-67]OYV95549.1 MAG: hypothetical protein B7Z60_00965 [Ferrovum sp. 37-45-19]OZB31589.1 MAG: hypothetical protein B7X47_10155 [Ferrovum sp. 34-44-207]HQT81890.1 hypothetical protein [Ferrovaceae bacterium]KRH78238.1 hypothetical protein FERRO_12190 [Ferrovum sp. JA12]